MSTPASHVWQPSTARTVVLDGFVPVPRGTEAQAPQLPLWPLKDPNDVLDYQFDISAALTGNPGDGIATLGVTIAPDNPGDLTLNAALANGAIAVLWLAAGQSGTVYTVTITIGTLSGRTLARSILLPVISLSSLPALPNDLITSTGAVLTDQNGNPILITGSPA
jgi:hypothetical protein